MIELLIAVLIIGILAAIALPAFNKQRERAKDSAAQQSLEAGLRAAKAVYAEGESFPASGLATLLGRAERSQSFAEASAFPVSAGTINVERPSASRVILRSLSTSGNQHMLALDEPNSRVLRYAPTASATGPTLPSFTNLLTNPNFEGTASWNAWYTTPSVASSSDGREGGALAVRTNPTTAYAGTCRSNSTVPGNRYSASYWFKVSVSGSYRAELRNAPSEWYGHHLGVQSWRTLEAGQWYQLRASNFLASPAATDNSLCLIVQKQGSNFGGEDIFLDQALLVDGAVLPEYFDGSYPAAAWSGAAHGSTSTGYSGSSSSW